MTYRSPDSPIDINLRHPVREATMKEDLTWLRSLAELSSKRTALARLPVESYAGIADYLVTTLMAAPPGKFWGVAVPIDGIDINEQADYAAFTGNGPTSEANARFYSVARENVIALLDERDGLYAQLADLREKL